MSRVVKKPVFAISNQVLHKPDCTTTGGLRLEISEVEILYYVAKQKAMISCALTMQLILRVNRANLRL